LQLCAGDLLQMVPQLDSSQLLHSRRFFGDDDFGASPTVFDNVDNTMKIAREEIFGPVLSVIGIKDAEDGVRIANDSMYGLAAAVWARDITVAHRTARALKAGTVWVNCFDEGDVTVPFGGYKQSGFGRDRSLHAIDKYTQLKTTWVNLG